ncbi:MAG: hypothetical protein ABIV06_07635, partial [Thermoanaerobaculia bacterium]
EAVEGTVQLDDTTPVNLPDIYGLGLAWRSTDGDWTTSFEWKRVEYSSITSDLKPEVFEPGNIEISDGDEIHLGVEYVLDTTHPILAFRAGAWLDPAHNVAAGPTADTFEAIIFQRAEDEMHWSGGLGLVFDHFQLDLGADLSRHSDVGSLSIVYRF